MKTYMRFCSHVARKSLNKMTVFILTKSLNIYRNEKFRAKVVLKMGRKIKLSFVSNTLFHNSYGFRDN